MALAVDGSTPAIVTANPSSALTTATFNPPASILVACMHSDGDVTYTMSNNGAGITWTLIANRNAAEANAAGVPAADGSANAWWAELTGSRTGMTVTATASASDAHAMKLYVITGADTSDPIGGQTEGSSATNDLTTAGFTIEANNSLGFACGDDFSTQAGTTTSSDMTFFPYDVTSNVAGGSGYKTLAGAGGSATFNLNAPGAGTSEWNWISFEIKVAAAATPFISPVSTVRKRLRPLLARR